MDFMSGRLYRTVPFADLLIVLHGYDSFRFPRPGS